MREKIEHLKAIFKKANELSDLLSSAWCKYVECEECPFTSTHYSFDEKCTIHIIEVNLAEMEDNVEVDKTAQIIRKLGKQLLEKQILEIIPYATEIDIAKKNISLVVTRATIDSEQMDRLEKINLILESMNTEEGEGIGLVLWRTDQ